MFSKAMARGARAVGEGTNHGFARKLASSDRTTRERGVTLLVMWLSCHQEIGEEELKKIWKGLFYCLWQTDKVQLQAKLIERLAGLLESIDIELSLLFFKVFLSTMRREWGGIDRLRLDKFYLLLRKFISHMFKVLDKGGWDKELVTRFMDALQERAFLAKDRFPALGVNLHLTDIFWDEFRKFLPVPNGTLGLLLEPFYSTLSATPDKALLRRIRENVFNPLLDDGRNLVNNVVQTQALDWTAGRVGYLLNSTTVASRLFDLASSPAIAQANRKILYELNDEFSKLAKSLESFNGISFYFNVDGEPVLSGQGGQICLRNLEGFIENPLQDGDKGSRTRLGKRQARAVPGMKSACPVIHACKVKKPKNANMELSMLDVSYQEGCQKELIGCDGRSEDGKVGKKGKDLILRKEQSCKFAATANMNGPVLENKSGKRREKNVKNGPRKLVRVGCADVDAGSFHELETDRTFGDSERTGHRETWAHAFATVSGCSDNGGVDTDEVTLNLEKKFDFVAEEGPKDPFLSTTSVAGIPLASSRETRSKRKRRREKAFPLASEILEGAYISAAAAPSLLPVKVGTDELASSSSLKKAKKVRFSLKNNLVCKPHGPLPPLSVRTPPSATPRGSALKPGVLPGPVRTRPIRIARGTGLLKSRRRSPRQFLTMSLQKPKCSPKKRRNRKSF